MPADLMRQIAWVIRGEGLGGNPDWQGIEGKRVGVQHEAMLCQRPNFDRHAVAPVRARHFTQFECILPEATAFALTRRDQR